MLTDAMRSMDVSHSPESLTSYPRFPYHVPLARVLVRSRSRLTCSLLLDTCTFTDARLVIGYSSVSRFSFCVDDSYDYDLRLRFSLTTFFCRLVNSSMLTITAYAFSFLVCRLVSRLVILRL